MKKLKINLKNKSRARIKSTTITTAVYYSGTNRSHCMTTMLFKNKNYKPDNKPNLASDILKVLEKKSEQKTIPNHEAHKVACFSTTQATKKIPKYVLGAKYADKYFTVREAGCMLCLLEGGDISDVAVMLKISLSSAKACIKNMIAKVGCQTILELIDLIKASDFIQNINKICGE